MGIPARYYRKSTGNSWRDQRASVIFDSRGGPCGRFPLIPLHSLQEVVLNQPRRTAFAMIFLSA